MATELADGVLAGDRAAISQALNLVDDRRPAKRDEALALLERLESAPRVSASNRIGITGAPGAGKSTLLDALVRQLREREATVGIVAVDPSSQRTGGALLGDRMRVRSGVADPNVFFRSMAARDRLGGLADATYASVCVLSAAFDWVFVETVGVGQSEGDVAHLVDTLVFVAQPAAGDLLQFMKAGILEWPDLFVVNKQDLGPQAGRTAGELSAGLGLGEARPDGWTAPVLVASARDGVGVAEILAGIESHRAHLESHAGRRERRLEAASAFVRETLERRYGSYGLERIGGPSGLAGRVREAGASSTFRLVRDLSQEIEDALRKPAGPR